MKYLDIISEVISVKIASNNLPIKPASEDVYHVINSNFPYGKLIGNRTMPIEKLHGGVNLQDPVEKKRVENLVKLLSNPTGYISRLIVDQDGNVVEGQHRFSALQILKADLIPVTIIKDLAANINVTQLKHAIKTVQPMRSDNLHQLIEIILTQLDDENGLVANVKDNWDPPIGYEVAWNAGLDYLSTLLK